MKKRARNIVIRIVVYGSLVLVPVGYLFWPRGLDVRDGKHDRGRNGIWIGHAWLGDDGWFERYDKLGERERFRDPARVAELATTFRRHRIRDVYPHLCPATPEGRIMPVDAEATGRILDEFEGFRVMPWVGGVLGKNAHPDRLDWRSSFVASIRDLFDRHPRLAGVHVNIEPCPSGHSGFLQLLEDIRAALPAGKLLSVAAYPPPTVWHPYEEVHWEQEYYRQVAKRADQLAVMMYDSALKFRMVYRGLMAAWTREVLAWCPDTDVLLGLPAYDDEGAGYHDPDVENLHDALLGIHAGLGGFEELPGNYQGIAIYCAWEMEAAEWGTLRELFLGIPVTSPSPESGN